MNSFYGSDTVTVSHARFEFRLFCSGNFDIKDAPIAKNANKITEIVEADHYASTVLSAQELNFA